MKRRLAILGFGTVGQGLAEILLRKRDTLKREYDAEFEVVAISDLVKGALYHPDGLDLGEVMNALEATGNFGAYPDVAGLVRGLDSLTTIRDTEADTIIEATFTNVLDGQPGLDHCREALGLGKNVVTTNKGPIALALGELRTIADKSGARLLYEGTVMSGTPVIRFAASALPGNHIESVRAILNGTSNYILTRMEEGLEFQDALVEAQRLGYAEADPTNDVDGFDAQYKVMILAQALFGAKIPRHDVSCTGIRAITRKDVNEARQKGGRYKLVASLKETPDGVQGRVQPEIVSETDPLSGVGGATNAISFCSDFLGDVTVIGAGAGRMETGYALLADCLSLIRGQI